MNELFDSVLEADKKYISGEDLSDSKRLVVDEIVSIQKKIKKITKAIDELKIRKKGLEPDILAELEKLEASGVRLESALVYIQQGTTAPSFKKVYEAVKTELTPKVDKLLQAAYDTLSVKQDPSLKVEFERRIVEELGNKIVNFFKNIFSGLVDGVDQGITALETALGMQGA